MVAGSRRDFTGIHGVDIGPEKRILLEIGDGAVAGLGVRRRREAEGGSPKVLCDWGFSFLRSETLCFTSRWHGG